MSLFENIEAASPVEAAEPVKPVTGQKLPAKQPTKGAKSTRSNFFLLMISSFTSLKEPREVWEGHG